jgi:hypothetical protein
MIDALDDRPTPPRPPDLVLRVFEDGCAVIRSEEAPRMSYDNLT